MHDAKANEMDKKASAKLMLQKSAGGKRTYRTVSYTHLDVYKRQLMGVMLMSTTCFAAGTGTSAVTQPLENLKTLMIAVIGAVGVIILAKNVMEFAQAYQQQDSSTMNSALNGIVAGVMMAGISTAVSYTHLRCV